MKNEYDNKYNELLTKCDLFSGVDEKRLDFLLSCLSSKICRYKKNEYIALENEKFDGVGIVLNGEISIFKENYKGVRTIMANFKKGDMFGEIIAFAGTGIWPSTVFAQSDCEIMFVHPEKILGICEKLCDSHRVLMANMTRIISKKALILNKKVEYLTIKSMKAKLAKYLLEQYKNTNSLTFTMPLNREALADFLNVSRPSMSRELCKMRDEGIIEFYRNAVRILNIDVLEEYKEIC